MRTASIKIFQKCAISRLAIKKKKKIEYFALEMFENTSCHIYKECLFFLLLSISKITILARPLAASRRRKELVELNIEEKFVYQCSEGFLLGF